MSNYYENIDFFNLKKFFFLLIIIVPFFFIPLFQDISIILALLIFNILFSYISLPLRKFSMGIELTTFLTVIMALKYGSYWGAIIGMLFMITEYVGSMRISMLSLATIPSVMFIGFITPFFSGLEIATLGLVIPIIYNLLTFSLCFFIRRRFIGLLIFSVTNILFNKIFFSIVGPIFI